MMKIQLVPTLNNQCEFEMSG